MNSMLSRCMAFIISLSLLNGCASNPDAYQRVQKKHEGIRIKRAEHRTEKFLNDYANYQERIKSDYAKEFDILADPFSTLDQKERPLIEIVQSKMDSENMGFWEGFHPANDTLAPYPIERYAYWINDELIKAQRLEERFIRRALDTDEINNLIKKLEEIRNLVLESDAYQVEKDQRQASLVQP